MNYINDPYLYIFLMIVLTTTGQLLTKKGAEYSKLKDSLWSVINKYTVLAGMLIIVAPIFYILALRDLELSLAFAFTGLNYILVSLGGKIFFREQLNRYHYLGMLLIFLGVTLFGL